MDHKELESRLLELDEQIELSSDSKESQGSVNSLVGSDALSNSASQAESQLDSGIFFPMDEKQCILPDTGLPHEKCNKQIDFLKDRLIRAGRKLPRMKSF